MHISRTVRISLVASLVTLTVVASWVLVQPAVARPAPLASAATPTPLPTGDGQPNTPVQQPAAADNGADVNNATNAPSATFSYYRLLATAFNPRTSTTTFAYTANGCIYETGGTDNRFIAPLLIPSGSVIKFLRIYYNDTSVSSDLTAWLTRYQPGQTSEDLTSVDSVGSTGYGWNISPEVTHTVDLTNWAYTIIVAPNSNAISNTICGIRVAYYAPPIFGAFLPVIHKS